MSFFYECTIPFNGIQQTIRVLHLRAAQSLLENQQHWPRDRTGFYASYKAEFLSFSAAPKYAQVKWPQKLSQTSHHVHQTLFSHVFSPKNAS